MEATNARDYYLKSFELPNPGLRAYFSRVRKGQEKDFTTPFLQGETRESVLNSWGSILDQISDKYPQLYEFEQDLRSKVGPLSIMLPLEERIDDVKSYYESVKLKAEKINPLAVSLVIKEFAKLRGLRLRSEFTTVDKMKKSTNSGCPFFAKRRTVINKTLPTIVGPGDPEWETIFQVLNSVDYNALAILGWRGQEGGPESDDVKQRVVWMFPFACNIRELQCYQPLIEAAQLFNIVPAWVSMDAVDDRITKLFDTKSPSDNIICTDFSKFDQHFNSMMQNAARDILVALLTRNSESEEWIDDVFPVKYHIPICLDEERIMFGPHGMASGSGGTNVDETLVHRALQHESAILNHQVLNPNSQCLGDDGILSYPGIDVDSVVKTYSSHGQDMNPDKQHVSSDDCVYLRRWHGVNYRVNGRCVGVYSTFRALGRLCGQERYYDPDVWGPKAVVLRYLSIIENCKYHPLREEFADFCMKRDKYRLGLDIPGFLENLVAEAQKVIDYIPDFLGYTKSQMSEDGGVTGINNWWIVNYLKSKA